MKSLFTFTLVLVISIACYGQERNIETESVKLDNLITFIIENYSIELDSTETRNITFLIETYADTFNIEDNVILKQAFKLLSKRLNEADVISIVMHSNFNGIALSQANANDLKKLLYVIEHPKTSVKTFEEDGVELAYNFTKENFIEDAENSVVMIRLPNRTQEVSEAKAQDSDKKVKKNSNVLVLTAIALLPEIISVIKD